MDQTAAMILIIFSVLCLLLHIGLMVYWHWTNKKTVPWFGRDDIDSHLNVLEISDVTVFLINKNSFSPFAKRINMDTRKGFTLYSVTSFLHECGHALQEKDDSGLTRIRTFTYAMQLLGTIGILASTIVYSYPIHNAVFFIGILIVIHYAVTVMNEWDANKKARKQISILPFSPKERIQCMILTHSYTLSYMNLLTLFAICFILFLL
ncbi:zinc metallopeptidase (plasmid) [Pontibacillus sp. ALD_SL1]|uniref:zinc metallopeptidase n=1 Tax=Pontibacillus sp. ALD_SL1 TaxID=2777185 RepID=UPI001A972D5A|nr:zinc metallopeptidase [Pontibacillus sp. ALD_SL1]QST02278.1 zinc metallopeptidase [Pontibacillus sp. ALD_SL1]